MGLESGRDVIRIRGARQNNLKGFDLDIIPRSLVVITGLSGSGKSSLAFDTLYAEGQRRYIETFSPYARQFFDRMDKPRVDAIEGIPPAIALEQRNSVRTTRSTVGTMTEICDHMKILWPHLARLHCRQCGRAVSKESPQYVWERVHSEKPGGDVLVTFTVPLSAKLSLEEQLGLIAKQGFQRLLIAGNVVRLDEVPRLEPAPGASLVVVQDRVRLSEPNRARFVEACEQAYHFGHGKLAIVAADPTKDEPAGQVAAWNRTRPFSRALHCATCDIDYQEPTAALFSFNHPVGACPTCKGFGRIIAIDYDLAIPDRSKPLGEGAVKPWQTGTGAESQRDLERFAKAAEIPLDVPFQDLKPEHQRLVIEGDPDYGEGNEWPKAWYGVQGYFRWLESKAYKMHVRVLLSRYRAYRTCPACQGRRFQPDSLLWRLPSEAVGTSIEGEGLTLGDFYGLPSDRALKVIEESGKRYSGSPRDPFTLALEEVRNRLSFLVEVGVGYLTLDRPTRTLSGGETQRVNLTTCLGSRLVNTLFVLDEPSVGLHARDTACLVRILTRLRDLGNTVVVVEHEAAVMRAADQIIDLGPGHGDAGGEVVVQGPLSQVVIHPRSLTGAYLSGRRRIEVPQRRSVIFEDSDSMGPNGNGAQDATREARDLTRRGGEMKKRRRGSAGREWALEERIVPYGGKAEPGTIQDRTPSLVLRGLHAHNLQNLDVRIPLGRLVCLSGVSGSGKTTLAGELLSLLRARLGDAVSKGALGVREAERDQDQESQGGSSDGEPGGEGMSRGGHIEGSEQLHAVMLVDQSPIGRTPRSNPAVYTGAFEHLRDVFAESRAAQQRGLSASAFSFNSAQGQCEQCRGAGFEKIEMQFLSDVYIRCPSCGGRRYRPHILEITMGGDGTDGGPGRGLSIADLLELPVDDAIQFLGAIEGSSAARAIARLRVIQDVGLGYLRLGQPINTLSGGESQRLKLAGHLAEAAGAPERRRVPPSTGLTGPTLFIFDEPTTGLHFEDIRVLLAVFQRLVDRGDSVLIIEHNLDVLKCADWLIDLGPEGGAEGGRVVAAGPPERVAACEEGYTGRALREVLSDRL